MKRLAELIMRGRMQAVIAVTLLSLLSIMVAPVGIFCSAAIALVTLRQGAWEGFLVLAAAIMATSISAFQLDALYFLTIGFALMVWFPVWLAAVVLREGRHLSLSVEVVVWLSLLGIAGCYLLNGDMAELWRQMIPQLITPEMAGATKVDEMLNAMAPTLTGVIAASAALIVLSGLFIGRWWQAMLYNPGGFRNEFLRLKAPPRMSLVFLALLVLATVGLGKVSEIALNATAPTALLYAFAGIAVAHTYLSAGNMANKAVPMFYITLFLMPRLLLPVALVALLDTWLDIRKLNLNKT
jgi:uncharacterized protein YybS (DUF2232 family)